MAFPRVSWECARWFKQNRQWGFRTCPFTQSGFVRISSNVTFLPDAVSPVQAMGILDRITALADHEFWPADLSLREAIGHGIKIVGHRQITDAYLLALCRTNHGRLATLDRNLLTIAQEASEYVVLVP